jgi:hypothetical protein
MANDFTKKHSEMFHGNPKTVQHRFNAALASGSSGYRFLHKLPGNITVKGMTVTPTADATGNKYGKIHVVAGTVDAVVALNTTTAASGSLCTLTVADLADATNGLLAAKGPRSGTATASNTATTGQYLALFYDIESGGEIKADTTVVIDYVTTDA